MASASILNENKLVNADRGGAWTHKIRLRYSDNPRHVSVRRSLKGSCHDSRDEYFLKAYNNIHVHSVHARNVLQFFVSMKNEKNET